MRPPDAMWEFSFPMSELLFPFSVLLALNANGLLPSIGELGRKRSKFQILNSDAGDALRLAPELHLYSPVRNERIRGVTRNA